jgi:hypothetical protein
VHEVIPKVIDIPDGLAVICKDVLRKYKVNASQKPEYIRKIGPFGPNYCEHRQWHARREKLSFHFPLSRSGKSRGLARHSLQHIALGRPGCLNRQGRRNISSSL